MNRKRINLLFIFLIFGYLTNAQTPGWTPLKDSISLPGLEENPLKGIATQFSTTNTWNNFPYSIQGKVFMLGELMEDDGSFDLSAIDDLLEAQAQLGRTCIVQVNIDDGRLVSPLDDDYYDQFEGPQDRENGGLGPYKGHQIDLPNSLSSVNRIYYLGKPSAQNNFVQTTGAAPNIFPYDEPVFDADGKLLSGDDQGGPSLLVDYNDPLLIQTLKDLIVLMGQKYDTDPRMFMMHFGIYGIFGEFGLGYAKTFIEGLTDENGILRLNDEGQPLSEIDWEMTQENLKDLSDTYLTAFPNTKLVSRNAEVPNSSRYGFSDGLFFGASISTMGQNYFLNGLQRFGADQNWRNQVIGGEMDPFLQGSIWGNETTLDPNSLTPFDGISVQGDPIFFGVSEDQFIEEVFAETHPTFIFQNYALQNYALGNFGENHTTPNPLNAAENPYAGQENTNYWNNAIIATRKLGYTFYAKEFNLAASEEQFSIEVNIENLGVAPVYANLEVEFGYFDASRGTTSFTPLGTSDSWNLSTIQPDATENKRLFVFDNSSGVLDENTEYTFGLRIINPLSKSFSTVDENGISNTYGPYADSKPVRFANNTQDKDETGWLTLGSAVLSELDAVTGVVTSIAPNSYRPTMFLRDVQQLSVTITPSDIPVLWQSNLEQIVSVDQNGFVTTYARSGEVIIKAFTADGSEVEFPITVNPYFKIPSRIEAEDYSELGIVDNGNEFDDITAFEINSGEDAGQIGLDNLQDLDTLRYFVDVDPGGRDFRLKFRAIVKSIPNDAKVKVLDGNNNLILPEVTFGEGFPNNLFSTTTSDIFSLGEGIQEINIVVTRSNFDLNWIEFEEVDYCEGFDLTLIGQPCTDLPLGFENGVYTDLCSCEGTPIVAVDQLIEDGVYSIKAETNAYIVTTTSGEFVNSQLKENGNATKWEFTHLGNNIYTIGSVEFPGELLGVTFGGCGAFQAVGLTASPDASLPRFQWQAAEVDGKFVFNTVDCPGFSLDIFTDNPTTVHLFTSNNAEVNQLFELIPDVAIVDQLIEDGVYSIKAETNAYIVTTTSGGFANSQATESDNATKWEFTHLGNNVYTIGSVEFPGELLGVTFGGCGSFEAVGLTASPDASLPRFQWQAAEVNGKFVFNTVDCPGFSLDIFSSNPTTVHLFASNNTEVNQLLNLIPVVPIVDQLIEDGVYSIKSESNVYIVSNTSGGFVNSQATESGNASKWEFTHLGNNVYTIGSVEFPGEFIGVRSGECAPSQIVVLSALPEADTDYFKWEASEVNGKLVFNTIGCTEYSLDIYSNNSTTIRTWASSVNKPDQLFSLIAGEIDNTIPVINLVGDPVIDLFAGDSYVEQGATAIDDNDGDITSSIVIGGDVVTTDVIGTYVVTYNVSDVSGNAATEVIRTVNIAQPLDTEAPIALCNNLSISLLPEEVVNVNAAQLDGGSTDNVGIESISIDKNSFDITDLGSNDVTLSVVDNSGNVATCISTVTVEEITLTVTKFILVDADSNLDILEIMEGDVIDLANVPSNNFSIRAETTSDVESVRLELTGQVSKTSTENNAPYALFGDSNGNYNGKSYQRGSYNISADPYSENSLQGDLGTSLNVNFEFTGTPNKLVVTKFILVDADSNLDIQEIVEGDVIDLTNISSNKLSIRAETTSDVESVFLELDGPDSKTRTENVAPYTLYGDSNRNYNGRDLAAGTYSINADPYSGNSRQGIQGTSLLINFTLTENGAAMQTDNSPTSSHTADSANLDQSSVRNAEMNDNGSSEKIKVFPNPFQRNITLKLVQGKIYNKVFVQDLSGKIMTTLNLKNAIGGEDVELNVEGPSGIYLMYVESTEGIEVTKIVKL